MIVQPDFCEHWKTRRLVELTQDESAPMAVLRLWSHCQHSRRWQFQDMTPAQLASICHWGVRKPPCHTALIAAGFVEKLKPKGFAAHQWDQHNAQLLQKWTAGAKGGRPSVEIPQDSQTPPAEPFSQNHVKNGDAEKPTGNRPPTGTKPDQIRSDQTRPDEIDQRVRTRSDSEPPSCAVPASPPAPPGPSGGEDSKAQASGNGGLDGLVAGLVQKITPKSADIPSLEQVRNHLRLSFAGAEQYAEPFFNTMEKQHWQDRQRHPITDWRSMAKSYASKAHLNKMA